jgi:hypothetical protein
LKEIPQVMYNLHQTVVKVKCKANSAQVWIGLEGSRRLRLPDFKTVGT